jgi:hypothetical protein
MNGNILLESLLFSKVYLDFLNLGCAEPHDIYEKAVTLLPLSNVDVMHRLIISFGIANNGPMHDFS